MQLIINTFGIRASLLTATLNDAEDIVIDHCFGARQGFFPGTPPEAWQAIGDAFATIRGWVSGHYGA